MENTFKISHGYYPIDIKKAEKKYNAKYIGDFSIRDRDGHWTDKPVMVFYVENPDTGKGHTNYFGLFCKYIVVEGELVVEGVYITDGSSAFSEPLQGVVADNGEIVISCYAHDYRVSSDGSVTIDGGRSGYIRTNKDVKLVNVIVEKDQLKIQCEGLTNDLICKYCEQKQKIEHTYRQTGMENKIVLEDSEKSDKAEG